MNEDSVIDYSGEEFGKDFLNDNELDFVFASMSLNDTDVQGEGEAGYNSIVSAIITGVTASHNLKKLASETLEKSSKRKFDGENIDLDAFDAAKKMLYTNKTISELVMKLFELCEEQNKFWHNCSVNVYKYHFESLKKNYTKKYLHATFADFLRHEYVFFSSEDLNGLNTIHSTIAKDDMLTMVDYISRLNLDNLEFFKIGRQRKLDFLEEQLQSEGLKPILAQTKKGFKVGFETIKDSEREADEQTLGLSNLPSYNLEERYEIFTRLSFEKTIMSLDAPKASKDKLAALILGCSIENAKKLLNGTYKNKEDKKLRDARRLEITGIIDDFLQHNKIKMK